MKRAIAMASTVCTLVLLAGVRQVADHPRAGAARGPFPHGHGQGFCRPRSRARELNVARQATPHAVGMLEQLLSGRKESLERTHVPALVLSGSA